MQHPPEGMTAKETQNMSDEALLDMDYFLTEKITIKNKIIISQSF